MILLFTDFGLTGPYLGQVEAVLHRLAPRQRVINLMADVPRQNVRAAACLLAALAPEFPVKSVFFCVADPGVGSFEDRPIALRLDGSWFVGPDNGMFDLVARRARRRRAVEITWRPERLSSSFHGRDLYAPTCAALALGRQPRGKSFTWRDRHNWPDDAAEIIYIDAFGNCMTGIRAATVKPGTVIRVGRRTILHAKTFSAVRAGQAFWYANSNGLVELAVNRGSAAETLRLAVGDPVGIEVQFRGQYT